MEILSRFQLHIFTLMVLIILFVVMKTRSKIDSQGKKILRTAAILAFFGVLMEPISWIFDGKIFFGSFFLEYGSNLMIILLPPMIGSLMLGYVFYKVKNKRIIIWKQILFFPPTVFTIIMLLINAFYPIYFGVNFTSNVYFVGDYIWIHYVLIGGIYICFLILMYLYKSQLTLKHMLTYSFFFLLPIIGMIIQLFQTDVFFAWNSIVLSILVIYIFFETSSGDEDYLTQLFSRKSYESYVKNKIELEEDFSIVYFDLNDFKSINDNYGHGVGDDILILFSEALKKAFMPNQIVCRLGGDEFIVVIDDQVSIDYHIDRLRQIIKSSNHKVFNQVQFSYGYQTYQKGMTIDMLYLSVDKKMYGFKRKNNHNNVDQKT